MTDHDLVWKAQRLVLEFFGGNEDKTKLWFATPNPLLGGVAPNTMIRLGREDRLLKFIRTSLWENEPPDSGGKEGA